MRRAIQVLGLVGLMTAGGLATAGTASAAPLRNLPPACRVDVRSMAMPAEWIPVSAAERDRRLRWDQVRRWDRNNDGRLSATEIRVFRAGNVMVPGGPDCGRPENPPRRR
jgi:hypothetical protein